MAASDPLQRVDGVWHDEAWPGPIATGHDGRDERPLSPQLKRQAGECAAGAVTR